MNKVPCFLLVFLSFLVSLTATHADIPIDVSKVSYKTVAKHHHSTEFFKKNIADDIVGAGDVAWEDSGPGLNSCAVRMSIALAWGGINWGKEWPECPRCWKLKGKTFVYPSKASDYKDLLKNPKKATKKSEIAGQKGVILFEGGFQSASGHVTLWNGKKCVHDDGYWDSAQTIYFWKLAD